jgi:hypothetical protein
LKDGLNSQLESGQTAAAAAATDIALHVLAADSGGLDYNFIVVVLFLSFCFLQAH